MRSRAKSVPVVFPTGGLALETSYLLQPPATTRNAVNVRPYDTAGRLRGGRRPGTPRHTSVQIDSGAANTAVQFGGAIAVNASHVAYTNESSPSLYWSLTLDSGIERTTGATFDAELGILYILTADSVFCVQGEGQRLWRLPIPILNPNTAASCIKLAEDGSGLFIGYSQSNASGQGGVVKVEFQQDELAEVWRWDGVSATSALSVTAIDERGGYVYAVGVHLSGQAGFLARISDAGTGVNDAGTWQRDTFLTPKDVRAHTNGTVYVARAGVDGGGAAIRFDQLGNVIWRYESQDVMMDAIRVGTGENPSIYVSGRAQIASGQRQRVFKLADNGTSASLSWTFDDTTSNHYGYDEGTGLLFAVDRDGHCYYTALDTSGSTNPPPRYIKRLNVAGSAIDWSVQYNPKALFVDANRPPGAASTVKVQSVWVSGAVTRQLRQVSQLAQAVSNRTVKTMAVVNGKIKLWTTSTTNSPDKSGTLSQPELATSAQGGLRWIHGVPFRQKMYLTDGNKYVVYDPSDNAGGSLYGNAYNWVASAGGNMPPACKLLELWRQCTIHAGNPADPQNFYLSAQDDPHNHDYFPAAGTLATQATAGNYAPCGMCPDIINAIIPISDDRVLFGGDHTLYMLSGHPMQGGRIDLVSRVTGVAFGRAWSIDARGTVYFFGARGGVYRMAVGEQPVDISLGRVASVLRAVNLDTNKVMLQWNDELQGLHVFITPISAAATVHYWWCSRTNSWWSDVFSATGLDPTCCFVIDGDAPSDRFTVIGARDGYIRRFDPAGTSDGTASVASEVDIGPFTADDWGRSEVELWGWKGVLATSSANTTLGIYATDDTQALGSVVFTSTMVAGRNPGSRNRARGRAIFARLSGNNDSPWGLEELVFELAPAGDVRDR